MNFLGSSSCSERGALGILSVAVKMGVVPVGPPVRRALEEWEKARIVCVFMKTFHDATMVILGSYYPTVNLYFHEIWEVKIAMDIGDLDVNADLFEKIQYMQRKFRRCSKLIWLQISFPVIFYPRFKLGFIDFHLKEAFRSEAKTKVATVKKVLLELFKDYSQVSIGS
jgi:hypothetical protein